MAALWMMLVWLMIDGWHRWSEAVYKVSDGYDGYDGQSQMFTCSMLVLFLSSSLLTS